MIFNNIIAGSVFPFIDVAINKNYDVVMPVIYKKNQTDNIDSILDNMWKAFIQIRYKYITDIVIISHKTATINLIKLMNKYPSNFIDKTRKIMLINSKHFDIDKYASRFGDNFPNDKRQLKSVSATLNIIKRFCSNCDMEAILILRDKNPNVPNPMNREVAISLTEPLSDDLFTTDYNASSLQDED